MLHLMLNASFWSAEMTASKRYDLNLTTGKLMVRHRKGERLVQKVLSHLHLSTTMLYTHISNENVECVLSPFTKRRLPHEKKQE